jgi:hypothetical protein
MKLSRRQLVTAALTSPAASAQAPAKPATPEEELAAARVRVSQGLETIRKFPLDLAVEPDFTFRA